MTKPSERLVAHAKGEAIENRKIGILGPYPPFRGGIAHFTEQFHLNLAAHITPSSSVGGGVKPEVFGVSFKRQYPSILFPGKSQYSGLGNTGINAATLLDSINPVSWGRTAEAFIDEGVDEVVFMYWMPFFAPAYLRVAQILQRAGIRVTALVHNASPHKRQPFGSALTRIFLSRCDRIIALSGTVKRDIVSIGVSTNVEVSKHPVYNQFGDATEPALARKQLGLAEEEPVMLFFGLVRRYKGLDILLKALPKTNSKAKLLVAGEWYEDHSELKRLIEVGNLSDRVICHDKYIPDEEVHSYFSAADVLIQPYRTATQSGVVQTAFHFGLPSIVSGVGGLPEMIEHENNGLVVAPEDPDALANAIDEFYRDSRKERLTLGAKESRAQYSWEAFVTQFLS